jgi:hypothetical protein
MKKIIIITAVLVIGSKLHSQTLNDVWNQTKNTATQVGKDVVNGVVNGTTTAAAPSLSNEEVVRGLREALSVGTNNSAGVASKLDGYYKNPRLFIPWPQEAQDMKSKLVKLGMQKKVDEFETSLNRAAEEAAKKAAPVFIDAITKMSVSDGFAILKGADTAATGYLRKATYSSLSAAFMPIVKEAIEKVKVTSYWNPLVTKYNKIPGVKKQNPDLNDYVMKKAINGLFLLVAEEEMKIRKDPVAQVTDLLKKVFGSLLKK